MPSQSDYLQTTSVQQDSIRPAEPTSHNTVQDSVSPGESNYTALEHWHEELSSQPHSPSNLPEPPDLPHTGAVGPFDHEGEQRQLLPKPDKDDNSQYSHLNRTRTGSLEHPPEFVSS